MIDALCSSHAHKDSNFYLQCVCLATTKWVKQVKPVVQDYHTSNFIFHFEDTQSKSQSKVSCDRVLKVRLVKIIYTSSHMKLNRNVQLL